MTLVASVEASLGTLELRTELSVEDGEVLSVVGPNGAGKTTLLRSLAGLVPVRRARVVLDGVVLDDTAAEVSVPAERRRVGFVFQDYLLFPHLSVLDNVAFGLRSGGARRDRARREALVWLEQVGLADLAGARPEHLSGGQRQRVALARALATRPRLLLLDEPLAAIEFSARAELRKAMRRALGDFEGVGVLVTHDPIEAFSVGQRVAVMEHGTIVQEGTVSEVASRPRSAWAARMLGLNLFRGRARRGTVSVFPSGSLTVASGLEGEVFAVVAPRSVSLHRDHPEGSPRNVWPGEVDSIDLEGERVRVTISGPLPIVAEVTPAAVADLGLGEGGRVWCSLKATEVDVYPA